MNAIKAKSEKIKTLADELKQHKNEIKTDAYPMSIGELINLYKDKELDLHPEFQRFFRWTIHQKSNLIESILLGIPIPTIFVAVKKTGVWEVVDGLQRLSTLFEFVGILRDENDELKPPLILEGAKYLKSLQGKTWEENDNCLTPEQRIDFKRSKLQISMILKESAMFTKFELFKRLNTGGSLATEQEVRNCIIVSTNKRFLTGINR